MLDFMATACQIPGIDYARRHVANDRPVRLVDAGAKPIAELFP